MRANPQWEMLAGKLGVPKWRKQSKEGARAKRIMALGAERRAGKERAGCTDVVVLGIRPIGHRSQKAMKAAATTNATTHQNQWVPRGTGLASPNSRLTKSL
jgi:hypothetical protein